MGLIGRTVNRAQLERYSPWFAIALAAFFRLWNLGYLTKLVFDETYYVKDAWTLWNTGAERAWPEGANAAFESGSPNGYLADPSFVVHPPFGKWVIGFGMWLFGAEHSFSWRISIAVLSIAAVGLIMVVAKLLLSSKLWAAAVGLLFAIDGHAIVLGRTGLLDGILMFLALLAFYFVLRDQIARNIDVITWRRPWLIAAGATLGLAASVKWSGLYFLAAFGLYIVVSETLARRTAEQERWLFKGVVDQGLITFVLMVPTAIATYLLSWSGWLITGTGYDGKWADDALNRASGFWSFVPARLQSLWHYHQEAYGFHVNLHTPHSYSANPLTWLLGIRPTSFFYESIDAGKQGCLAADSCSSAITALGNLFIWLPATAALLFLTFWYFKTRDRVSGLILLGMVGGYLPWLAFMNRTVFQFYSIAFLPFMILALALALKLVREMAPERFRTSINLAIGGYLALCLAASLFFLPIWIGTWVPFWFWQVHMWLPSWI